MKITENFTYIGTQQNFERDSYATLAEMKAVADKRMPDIFTATCKETGKLYIYNKSNEVDETLGKWREISIDGNDYVTKTYVDTEIAKKADTDHTHTTVNGHTVESDVPVDAKFTDTVYDDTDIKAEIAKKADITSIPSKVSELTNDSNYQTAEQVSSTVTTEIAKVVADAPEDLNTLKEMSDWIAGHENDASAMNSAISDNKAAITALQSGKADKSEIPTTVAELTDSADYAKKSDLHSHTNKTVLDGITSTKVSNWDSAKTHADSAHAPSNAQANVIETVNVNGAALTPSSKAVNVIVPTKVSELTDSADYAKKTDIPTTLPANGGNANTVNNHTVESDVPADAVFTDTVYDDTEVKESIDALINDSSTGDTNSTWSSSKINSSLNDKAKKYEQIEYSTSAIYVNNEFITNMMDYVFSVLKEKEPSTLGGGVIKVVELNKYFMFQGYCSSSNLTGTVYEVINSGRTWSYYFTATGQNVVKELATMDKLGGLTFSVSGTTLSITDGTHTWTLEANS